MKKTYWRLLCFAGIQIAAVTCYAQEGTLALKAPASAATIDGDNKEWGDSLAYYNPSSKLNYGITNDKENLYLVIKTNDVTKQNYILSSGVTFGIDTKGRKKAVYAVTFPESGQESPRRWVPSLDENKMRASILNFRKIGVKGFKDITEDDLNLSNVYGIRIAVGFDAKGYMTYEEAIPLDLFHAGDLAKNEWSFTIKLNPPERPETNNMNNDMSAAGASGSTTGAGAGAGGRGGSSGRGARVSVNTFSSPAFANTNTMPEQKPIEFWGKLTLAVPTGNGQSTSN
jgi:hypothetical protein